MSASPPRSSEAPAPDLLFVYGTLRRAAGHAKHRLLANVADHVAPARVRGWLVVVDWYPGLVPGDGWVHGELWRLRGASSWLPLDRYEGCGPSDPPPHEYRREMVEAVADATAYQAWVYTLSAPREHLPRIASGDWLQR
jgi:gamma-glutamylcyclotransferase (GGCT)/AIG2-like uncharacterized protein YtfP